MTEIREKKSYIYYLDKKNLILKLGLFTNISKACSYFERELASPIVSFPFSIFLGDFFVNK